MKIRMSYDYPPIPDRRFDWSAVDDNYDIGDAIGRGPTEFEAILDLLKQLDEKRVGWPDMLDYTSSPLPSPEAVKGGQAEQPLPLPSQDPFHPHCLQCRRFLLVGEMFVNGRTDNPLLCHACIEANEREFDTLLRDAMREDARLAAYYEAEESISGREDTEEIGS